MIPLAQSTKGPPCRLSYASLSSTVACTASYGAGMFTLQSAKRGYTDRHGTHDKDPFSPRLMTSSISSMNTMCLPLPEPESTAGSTTPSSWKAIDSEIMGMSSNGLVSGKVARDVLTTRELGADVCIIIPELSLDAIFVLRGIFEGRFERLTSSVYQAS